ncbi:MAG: hypothetical protein LBV74_13800 [Tannerella sp.]|jgi:hypothetical protein|nr:hypothetical protein [Tannerella sp.]
MNIFRLFLLISLSSSCTFQTQLEKNVLKQFPAPSRQREAACYLLDHLPYHSAYEGEVIERFSRDISDYEGSYSNLNPKLIDSIWYAVSSAAPAPCIAPHDGGMAPDFIIDHVRTVFAQWDRCAWKDSLDFDVFCEYILPYSIQNEPLTEWRTILHDKYYPLIEGIACPKEAFDVIYNHIYAGFDQEDRTFAFTVNFTPDPLLTDKLMRGTCDIRTSLIVAVARSLCIPVAYDFVKYWANFSTRGHSWPVYVGTKGKNAYVLSTYDSVSRERNIHEIGLFRLKQPFNDTETVFKLDSLKKIAKIFRFTFAVNPTTPFGNENLYVDVSLMYGFADRIEWFTDRNIYGKVHLCTFMTGEGWVSISTQTLSGSSRISFEAVGRDVTYLLAESGQEGLIPLANPITLHRDGSLQCWNPDTSNTDTVVLYRKYMLRTTWADRGRDVIGTTFEVSDTEDFRRYEVLHTIQIPPLGVISVEINKQHPARYIRTKVPLGTRRGLSEIAFFAMDETGREIELRGELIYDKYLPEDAAKAIDRSYLSSTYSRIVDCWVGYDFGSGKTPTVTRIEYCPWNDGNMIERGDRYELLYYDMGWHSLGQKVADGITLEYCDVPAVAMLWLRNLTKGHEERIFTYQGGKQIWW